LHKQQAFEMNNTADIPRNHFKGVFQPIKGQQVVCVTPAQPTYGTTVPISSYSLPPAFSVEMQPFPSVDSEKNLKE